MMNITDEIVRERTGEPLDVELQKNGVLQGPQERLQEAIDVLISSIGTLQNGKEAYEQVEEAWMKYDVVYGETAYRLGLSDGMKIGKEKGVGENETVFSLEDMATLIRIYDAVRELNGVLYGDAETRREEDGVMCTLGSIYDLIANGVCAELKLLGDDEVAERLTSILDGDMSPCERAKRLLGKEDAVRPATVYR